MNLLAVAVLSTGARSVSGLSSEVPKFYWGTGLSTLFFTGDEGYEPTMMLDGSVAYDFMPGSNVEFVLGYSQLGDLRSSTLYSIPVMLSLKLGQEWLLGVSGGRYYMLLSGGAIVHWYDLSHGDALQKEQEYLYDDYDYTVASDFAWSLGAGVEFYSLTSTKTYLSIDCFYMWHDPKATHEMDGSKVSGGRLDLDALVLRVGLAFQF